MTTLEPEVADTGRYSLGETCKVLKLSMKTVLKNYEAGHIRCTVRKDNGRKVFQGSDIKRFWKGQF